MTCIPDIVGSLTVVEKLLGLFDAIISDVTLVPPQVRVACNGLTCWYPSSISQHVPKAAV
jgi:hypothetical protein